MVQAQIIAMIRGAKAGFQSDTCTIEARQTGVDQFGAPQQTWGVVATDVACRVIDPDRDRPVSGSADVGEREAMIETYRLSVPAGTGLAPDQRVTVGANVFHVVRIITERTDETDEQAIITRARRDEV